MDRTQEESSFEPFAPHKDVAEVCKRSQFLNKYHSLSLGQPSGRFHASLLPKFPSGKDADSEYSQKLLLLRLAPWSWIHSRILGSK